MGKNISHLSNHAMDTRSDVQEWKQQQIYFRRTTNNECWRYANV